jgi:cytochrome c peroxidase
MVALRVMRISGLESRVYYSPPPDGAATAHIGTEVFYDTDGNRLPDEVWEYDVYFGGTADQALNPMPNTVEQNIERQGVYEHVASSKYAELYELAWGVPIDCSGSDPQDPAVVVQAADVTAAGSGPEMPYDISFKRFILAICAWQHSGDLNSFSSKRDEAIANAIKNDGEAHFPLDDLSCKENYGHALFYGQRGSADVVADRDYDCEPDLDEDGQQITLQGGNCAFCHSNAGPAPNEGTDPEELYTAQDYHNIGVPLNPEIPALDDTTVQPAPDEGISSHTGIHGPGFLKVPTLRNVDKRKGNGFTKCYTHNGWFKSLESIVHFYNTADVKGATAAQFGITRCPDGVETEKEALKNNCWPEPEFEGSAIPFLVGDLGLKPEDETAIVAYLKTLTDTHTAKAPSPYKSSKK